MSGRGNTIEKFVPVGFYTRGQLADLVGVSKDTVKRWADLGVLVPNPKNAMAWGTLTVSLYSREDLAKAQTLARRTTNLKRRKNAA